MPKSAGYSLPLTKVLYQRISYELHQELYDDRLKFILCEDKNIVYDNFVELLEVSE